jgi:5'-nucleotidase
MDVRGNNNDYATAVKFARKIVNHAISDNLKNDIVLNINIPALKENEIKGIKVSQLGNRIYTNCYVETLMDNSDIGYKIEGFPTDNDLEDTDVFNFKRGYVTVTPLHYDLTNFRILNEVDLWFKE